MSAFLRLCAVLMAFVLAACGPGLRPTTPIEDPDTTDDEPSAEIVGIGMTPDAPVVELGDSLVLKARAYYPDGAFVDVSGEVEWVSNDTRVAQVSPTGILSALSPGKVEVVAVHQNGMTAVGTVTVPAEDVVPVSVELRPEAVELHAGDHVQLAANATFSDGSVGNVAASCTWNSTDREVATVDDSGTVTGMASGVAIVKADCDGLTAQAGVTVVSEETDLGEPDLKVTSFSADVSGEDVVYTVQIANSGDNGSGGFYVDVHLDASSAPDGSTVGDAYFWVSGLSEGETRSIELVVDSVTPGSYDSWVIVDPEGYVAEGNEGNNTKGPISVLLEEEKIGPQLEITYVDALSDGSWTYWEVDIHNAGDETALDFWVDVFFDEFSDPSTCDYGDLYELVDSLAPGATTTLEFETESGPSLYWDSVIFVDSCDDVEEADETDNLAWYTIYPE